MRHRLTRSFLSRIPRALLVVSLICGLSGSSLLAQDPFDLGGIGGFGGDDSPVRFSAADIHEVTPGSDVVVKVVAKIERGWHIYSFEMDPELGIPTTMYVVSCGDLQMPGAIQEPTPHEREDPLVGGLISEHEGTVEFKVPFKVPEDAEEGPRKVVVDITYQACDATMCLEAASATAEATVHVGAADPGETVEVEKLTVTASALDSPVSWTGTGAVGVAAGADFFIEIEADIERGWHIYGLEMDPELGLPPTFALPEGHPFQLGDPIEKTPAHSSHSPMLNAISIEHERNAIFRIPVEAPSDLTGPRHVLPVTVAYVVCDAQICLPPDQVTLEIPVIEGQARSIVDPEPTPPVTPQVSRAAGHFDDGEIEVSASFSAARVRSGDLVRFELEGSVDEGYRIPEIRKDVRGSAEEQGLLGVILLAISGALLALVTPCVYPMIPITVSVFTKQAHESRARVLGLALLFGAGIVVSFTALGFLLSAILGEEGANFMATNGYVNLAIGVLFVVFGFSLFGYYDIQLPAWIRNRVGGGGGGGAASVLVMGLVFSITTFTCVGPIVAALLALAAGEGPGFAAVGMLAFSSTIALPFVILGLFPKALTGLPRSGGWLSMVKVILGFIELLAAWKFLSAVATYWQFGEILNREVIMAIWGLTFVALFLNLLGRLRFPHDSPVTSISFGRGLLLALTVFCAINCFYAISGYRLNENLEAQLLVPSVHAKQHLPWRVLDRDQPLDFSDELSQLQQQIAAGSRSPRPIFINFTGHT
ncbi:MAG: cytochrome c biogenesis protein CcdA [Planctomycetota bacterium]|nr:cytochrome c biogenesis protein CcdA [Planctomycetota bacterium]